MPLAEGRHIGPARDEVEQRGVLGIRKCLQPQKTGHVIDESGTVQESFPNCIFTRIGYFNRERATTMVQPWMMLLYSLTGGVVGSQSSIRSSIRIGLGIRPRSPNGSATASASISCPPITPAAKNHPTFRGTLLTNRFPRIRKR